VDRELYTAKRKHKYCKQNCFFVTRLRIKENQLSSKYFATSPISPKYNFESCHTQAPPPSRQNEFRNVHDFTDGDASEYFEIPNSKFHKLTETKHRNSFRINNN
jgi:hypothetical protein